MSGPLHPDSVHRFQNDVRALGIADGAPLGLAVSGGADSLALLVLARAAGYAIEAATVDHGLRAAAQREARHVAAICDALGVPHASLRLGKRDRGNVSAWARRARYAALANWADTRGIVDIATGHHADDQLETVMMRLNRGAGVGGLAGIRARNGRIVRPLLGWRRSDLAEIVADHGLAAIDDPSNRDDRYDRARLRKALAGADWLDPIAVARSAALLAEAEAALDWAAEACSISRSGEPRTVIPAKLPAELLRRLVLKAIAAVDPACAPDGVATARLMAALHRGENATIGTVLARSDGMRWTFAPAPPRRPLRAPKATSKDEAASN